ncbi:MAG: hypothetical protein DRO36_03100, partial [Candidatus Hecatellales archaeon]
MSEKKGLKENSKPFYLKPPWQILFDLARLRKIYPWDINIAYLLSSFLVEMKKRGYIDFAASGTALLSSSIILRLQSERILKLEEPPKPPQPQIQDYVPPPLQLPFRFELTSTTIQNLLNALEEVLKSESFQKPVKVTPIEVSPPDIFQEQDKFFAELEQKTKELFEELKNLKIGGLIPFSKIVSGKSKIEVVRTF